MKNSAAFTDVVIRTPQFPGFSENGHQGFVILEDFNSVQLEDTELEKYTMQKAQMFGLIKRVDEMEEWTK